jgi:uncharacterized membrane protein YeaQ/YmgE (transglycosylase-associated protein family)
MAVTQSSEIGRRPGKLAKAVESDHAIRAAIRLRCSTLREAKMDLVGIIIFLLIGAIAGWLAGQIMKGGGYGLLGDIIVGIVGAAIAGFLLPRLGIFIGGSIIGAIINATIGACILLFVIRLVQR